MWTETSGLIGVGYEGATPEELYRQLESRGVTTLVDVRLNPISRKKGFSKKSLATFLEERGISYLHAPALGNPRDNRDAYSEVDTVEGRAARQRYKEILSLPAGSDALQNLAKLAEVEHVAVFCYEESELRCHRHEVLKAAWDLLERVDR